MEHLEPAEEAPVAGRSSARLAGIAAALLAALALGAVVIVQSGDGETKAGDPQSAAQASATTSSLPGGSTSTTIAGSTTTSPAAPAPGSPTTTAPTVPSSPDDYKYQVTLSAPCARPGESFTVVMHLQRDDTASLLVRYADYQDHGAKKAGAAGPDGRFEYTFSVAPTPGEATVVTSAYRRSDGRSGTTSMTFNVIPPGGSCP